MNRYYLGSNGSSYVGPEEEAAPGIAPVKVIQVRPAKVPGFVGPPIPPGYMPVKTLPAGVVPVKQVIGKFASSGAAPTGSSTTISIKSELDEIRRRRAELQRALQRASTRRYSAEESIETTEQQGAQYKNIASKIEELVQRERALDQQLKVAQAEKPRSLEEPKYELVEELSWLSTIQKASQAGVEKVAEAGFDIPAPAFGPYSFGPSSEIPGLSVADRVRFEEDIRAREAMERSPILPVPELYVSHGPVEALGPDSIDVPSQATVVTRKEPLFPPEVEAEYETMRKLSLARGTVESSTAGRETYKELREKGFTDEEAVAGAEAAALEIDSMDIGEKLRIWARDPAMVERVKYKVLGALPPGAISKLIEKKIGEKVESAKTALEETYSEFAHKAQEAYTGATAYAQKGVRKAFEAVSEQARAAAQTIAKGQVLSEFTRYNFREFKDVGITANTNNTPELPTAQYQEILEGINWGKHILGVLEQQGKEQDAIKQEQVGRELSETERIKEGISKKLGQEFGGRIKSLYFRINSYPAQTAGETYLAARAMQNVLLQMRDRAEGYAQIEAKTGVEKALVAGRLGVERYLGIAVGAE